MVVNRRGRGVKVDQIGRSKKKYKMFVIMKIISKQSENNQLIAG